MLDLTNTLLAEWPRIPTETLNYCVGCGGKGEGVMSTVEHPIPMGLEWVVQQADIGMMVRCPQNEAYEELKKDITVRACTILTAMVNILLY